MRQPARRKGRNARTRRILYGYGRNSPCARRTTGGGPAIRGGGGPRPESEAAATRDRSRGRDAAAIADCEGGAALDRRGAQLGGCTAGRGARRPAAVQDR